MASGVYGQICSNVALGGSTNNQGIPSAGATSPSADASNAAPSAGAASASDKAAPASGSHSSAAAAASASASAKPNSGATQLGASVLAVGGALAAFLA